jgi:hypothetical protein
MLYSTVKSAAIEAAASHGVTVDKKVYFIYFHSHFRSEKFTGINFCCLD